MKITVTACLAALTALILTNPQAALAQVGDLQTRLSKATQLDCHFSVRAASDWKGGKPTAAVDEADLHVTFHDIDADEGTAEAESELGPSLIVVRYSNDYLHLMQMFNSGPLYVTTVLARETSDGHFMAVHTRHEYSPTKLAGYTSRPEMYVGECTIGGDS